MGMQALPESIKAKLSSDEVEAIRLLTRDPARADNKGMIIIQGQAVSAKAVRLHIATALEKLK